MPPADLTTVLLGQWQNSPRIRSIVAEIATPLRDETLEALAELVRQSDLGQAEGVWLDAIGSRLGLPRPSTTDPALDVRFGFDLSGQPFDQAPFRGSAANDLYYPLPDDVYRRFLHSRAVTILSVGSFADFRRGVQHIDPDAAVTDLRDMRLRVVTSRRPFLELADEVGALPRNAGIQIVYADRERFGFDQAGVPFDRGPFKAS